MNIESLIALLEQAQRLNGNCEVLIQIKTNDSFNTVLANDVTEITYGINQIIIK